MAFKRLGPIVKQVVSRLVIDAGEGSGGTLPDAMKGTGTDEGAGQVHWRKVSTESGGEAAPVTTQPGKAPASSAHGRGRSAHDKAQPQRRADRPLLYVIEGGGDRRREGAASVAYRVKPTVNGPREFLKLVGG